MPTVQFEDGAYIHDADDLTNFVAIARRGPARDRAPRGEVEIAGQGTRQFSRSPGVTESFTVSTRTRDQDIVEFLTRRDGETILFRDRRSRFDYAVITSATETDLDNGVYEVSMTIAPIDHDPLPVQA